MRVDFPYIRASKVVIDILNLEPLYDYVLFSWDLYLYYTIRLFRFDVIQYVDRIKLQKEKWWTYFHPIVSYLPHDFSRKCRGIRPRRMLYVPQSLQKQYGRAFKKLSKFCQRFAFKNFPAICFQKAFKYFQRFAFKNFPAICFQKFSSDLLSKVCQLFSFQKAFKNCTAIIFQKFPAICFQKAFKIFPAISFQNFFQRFSFKLLNAPRWRKFESSLLSKCCYRKWDNEFSFSSFWKQLR